MRAPQVLGDRRNNRLPQSFAIRREWRKANSIVNGKNRVITARHMDLAAA
jgi:hypothetical protein